MPSIGVQIHEAFYTVMWLYNLIVAKQLRIFTRMGKVKSSPSSRLCQYVSEFRNMFTSDDEALF